MKKCRVRLSTRWRHARDPVRNFGIARLIARAPAYFLAALPVQVLFSCVAKMLTESVCAAQVLKRGGKFSYEFFQIAVDGEVRKKRLYQAQLSKSPLAGKRCCGLTHTPASR